MICGISYDFAVNKSAGAGAPGMKALQSLEVLTGRLHPGGRTSNGESDDKPSSERTVLTGEVRKLPMMPIRDMVIFPHMMTPFVVGRESSVRALEEALTGDRKIFWRRSTTPRSTSRARTTSTRPARSATSCRA
jgi:hypothetical protein